MKQLLVIIFCFSLWPPILNASHSFGGMDLCALYPQRMPPGIEAASLPQAQSRGAQLMQQYCSQCHELPGPGRHTVSEWPAIMEQMNLLMDVSSHFGGLLGRVAAPTVEEREIIRQYLLDNALQAMAAPPAGLAGRSYAKACDTACHALPDPAQHRAEDWPAVIKRMQGHMMTMQYAPPSPQLLLQAQEYLQRQSGTDNTIYYAAAWAQPDLMASITTSTSVEHNAIPVDGASRYGALLALGPFLLLMSLGIARWWLAARRERRSKVSSEISVTV